MLCLLPFEPEFYRNHAVRAEFVGHPLADQIPLLPDRAAARAVLGLERASDRLLALLPGSRLGEVQRLAAPFLAAAIEWSRRRPGLQLVAPMANARCARSLSARSRACRPRPGSGLRMLDGQARACADRGRCRLVASGTATLEALLCRCPMVVAYRFGAVTALLLRTLRLVRLPYFSLPNLLAGRALVPEFLQEAVTAGNLCRRARARAR